MKEIKIIAFYLPQYHPIKENDLWWGKGFTEWTNVGKAKPLFHGHEQPKVPTDLGYYDLRLPLVRIQQVEYAKKAGIYGFCYWHYWMGEGKMLMQDIFEDVLESRMPDFPFCLGWANHSWYAKAWGNDSQKDRLLIEQKYGDENECRSHYKYVLRAFKDKRYIKENGKPLFFVFRPFDIPEYYIKLWNEWAIKDGFKEGISFIANCRMNENPNDLLSLGYEYVYIERLGAYYASFPLWKKIVRHLYSSLFKVPLMCFSYKKAYPYFSDVETDSKEYVIPHIIPNWDHSPRSGKNALIYKKSSPELFEKHLEQVFNIVQKKKQQFIFLKSWNEWGEGNYLEPDLRWGTEYIDTLFNVVNQYSKNK